MSKRLHTHSMRRLRRVVIVISLLIVSLSPAALRAAAETGAMVLQYPLGARATAMGTGGVADHSDPDNIYLNPACVTAVNGIYTTESYQLISPLIDTDISFGHFGVGVGRRFANVLVGLNVTVARFAWGKSIVTDPEGSPLGEFETTESYFAITAGAAVPIGEQAELSVGVALKHVMIDYGPPQYETSSNAFDVGAVVSTTGDAGDWSVHPSIGIAATNMGPDLEFDDVDQKDPLPSWFNYGVAVRVDGPLVALGSNDVPVVSSTIVMAGNHGLNEQNPQWGFGYELAFMQIASVRWGGRTDDDARVFQDTWGVGLQAPVGPVRARFDYGRYTYLHAPGFYSGGSSVFPRDVFGLSVEWLLDG